MASAAEERIRLKVEASLRLRYPDARIIHELVTEQGGCRLDLAAVTEDKLLIVEVKSERDVLKRLADQIPSALAVANDVWVVVAQKHADGLSACQQSHLSVALEKPMRTKLGVQTHVSNPNPAYVEGLGRCWRYVEVPGGIELGRYGQPHQMPQPSAAAQLNMLWAEELRIICRRHRLGPASDTRPAMAAEAVEHLTGRQIRREVCAALRARPFPRADPPIGEAPMSRVYAKRIERQEGLGIDPAWLESGDAQEPVERA